ncbi:cellulase family glycosylhydrolase [Actinoplanes sp. CA-142083]|uniref:cellulase family glycosylhydrolase n=1 Tax=Actinoplanes sp. CA-142083 TaxID=3239903 RepID=UPI003D9276FE
MNARRIFGAALAVTVLATGLGAPASAKPDSFVKRVGSHLELNGKQFRFAGTNMYWLGLDENVGGVDYPTYFRIRDALDTAKAMGMTVVRSHMLVSSGSPKTLLPSKEAGYNDDAFDTIDYAIAYAGKLGLRLVLPLTDNWAYYHGGHADFTKPYGLPESAFYTDPRVIADYQAYVSHVMHHVNMFTGKRLIDDPAVMAWELGNELEGMTPDWINANAKLFSDWAPRQLIAAGRRFDIDPDTLAAPDVDIVDVHYYPPTSAKVALDAATIAASGKVYIAGEYASTSASPAFFEPLIADRNVSGMLSWSLFGHNDRYGYVQHDDGFTFHYPDGAAQMAYAKALGARPATRPVGVPLVTAITKAGGFNVLQWRGAAGADGYRVERRTSYGGWRPAHSGLLTDDDTPWQDRTAAGDAWYRVVPFTDGKAGVASEPRFVGAGETVVTDPAATLSSNLIIRPDGTFPADAGVAWASWPVPGARRAEFEVVASHRPDLAVQISDNGTTWRTVRSRVDGNGPYTISATVAAGHVRLVWPASRTRTGLALATFWAADPAPVTHRPAAFAGTAPAPGATGVIGPQSFSWATSAGAGYYTLTVSRNRNLSDPVLSATTNGTTYALAQGLEPGTTWYWSVRATNAAGSTTTPLASFETRARPAAPATIDDFEGYADDSALAAAYPRNPGGDVITPTLVASGAGHAMRLDVTAGTAGYAGVSRTFAPMDLWGQEGIELRLDRSSTQGSISIQFVANGLYWEATLPAGTPSGVVRVPFTAFAQPSWATSGPLDLRHFTQLSFYVGGGGTGRLVVDDVRAYPI